MDGIHDLGGRQGFGKVDVDEKEEAFHSDWEARAYGIVRAMSKPSDWTLAKFRFTREQIAGDRIAVTDQVTRPFLTGVTGPGGALTILVDRMNLAMVASVIAGSQRVDDLGAGTPSASRRRPRGP